MTNQIQWRFWEKQKKAMEHAASGNHDITVFLGGFRSGKSVSGARYIVKNALKTMDSKYLAMAVNYNIGKQTTYNVLFDMAIPGDNVNPFEGGNPENSPIVQHWTKLDKTLTLNNGSTIVLAGADQTNRYEGGSFNGAWIDEPGNYKNKLHGVASTLLERMDRGPPGSMLWTTTGKTGPLQKFVERREWPKTGDPVNNSIKVVKASTDDNPFLSKQALERLKRRYEGSTNEEMALHGEFGDVEGRVYPNFQRETHVKPRKQLEKRVDDNIDPVYGYDAGWDDEKVVLQVQVANDGTLMVLDEFYESNKFLSDVIDWLQDRPRGTLHSEHEPEQIRKMNAETSHRIIEANKSLDTGIDLMRQRIQKQGLVVAEECENTVEELLGYQKEDVGGTNVQDHACDVLRYIVMGVENQPSTDVQVSSYRAI
jgi:phage terminase large subunit